jgi:hypothetical protein
MTTDRHSAGHGVGKGAGDLPVHETVSFEARDIQISSVVWSLIYLAITIGISLVICVYFLKYTANYVESQDTPVSAVRKALSATDEKNTTLPQEPRLQGVPGHETDPQLDLRNKLAEDTKANERLGWIDEKAGIAQIPVQDAMKIIVEKGVSGAPAAAPEKKK